MAEELTPQLSKRLKEWLLELAGKLNWRVDRVLDSYRLAQRSEIIDVRDDGESISGIRLKVPSETRDNTYYYVSVGPYGAKCTCEASVIRGEVCKHIVAGLVMWNMLSVIKYGRWLDLNELEWLRQTQDNK
ncbi:SWIM zinc finger family protein [Vulcanisaeta distributa]|uniref:Zinc finger SWIM domain protein n=1 Tax=Vulcanisaeta distributa (strain DSM 14429 / JCM 11212 / NBRC 100878 / IC-017) TaxID=572478 RepID=E1QT65_VULDI|nr:SWIM zinc finger family protein [Vulcanisaeta distributa]ADN49657.1 zinc finger SWIM domain protein [Vulcanisaeta distributa DSM 14429]